MSYDNLNQLPTHDLQASIHGTLYLPLKNYLIELSINGGVYILCNDLDATIAISPNGNFTAIDHPMGKVFQYQNKIEIRADHQEGFRYAKIWKKGISFTTDQRMVTFLLDAGGVKTSVDWFLVMDDDLASKTFYHECDYGQNRINQAISMIHQSHYWVNQFGSENWKIGNVKITQNSNGCVKILKNDTVVVSNNPHNKSIFIKTPFLHCTASLNTNGHLFIRNEDRRVHYDGYYFNIKNAGQSAAIDNNNELKLS